MWPYMRLGIKSWGHISRMDSFLLEDVHEFHKFLNSIHDTIQWSELDIEKSSHHISWCLFVNNWNPQYSVLQTICLRPLPPLHTRQAHYHCHSLEKSCILLRRRTVTKKNFNTFTPLSSQMAINTTSWRWIYTHNPQTQQPHLKITPHNLPSMPPTIHLLTIYSENCNQK